MSKALETIKWFNGVEQDRKNKIEFMMLQRNERYQRITFDTIKKKTDHLRQFRARFEMVKSNHIETLKSSYFTRWFKKFTKKKANEPVKNFTSKFFRTNQMKKAFRVIYNHRTF